MRIAFNISRMNWYRVMSSAIDEALRRGYEVECWHNVVPRNLGDNFPNIPGVPVFKNGIPKIVEYNNLAELLRWIETCRVDVVVECYPPPNALMSLWPPEGKRPYWVMLDGPPCAPIIECNNERQLFACDLFAMQTKVSLENSINILTGDLNRLVEWARIQKKILGKYWEEYLLTRFGFQWQMKHGKYFLDRAVIVGNTALDISADLDADEIRKKFRIPKQRPVVTLLPCPFEWGQATWQQCFMSRNLGEAALNMLIGARFDMIGKLSSYVIDKHVVKAVRGFCDSNHANLVAKIRHSRRVQNYISHNADLIIEKETYHPHTALEIYKISDLVIGYYSTGCLEAVALNTPYLNVEMPFYPKEFTQEMWPPSRCYDQFDGCVYTLSARNIVKELQSLNLDDFVLDEHSQKRYLDGFLGPLKGNNSGRLFEAIEYLVENRFVKNYVV